MSAPVDGADVPRGGPPSLVAVGAGLAVYGIASYVYLGMAGNATGPVAFAPLSVVWTVLNAVGIGLFLPFEQELGRTTSARLASGQGNGPVAGHVMRAGAGLLVVVCGLSLALMPYLADVLFAGRGEFVVLTVLGLAGMGASYAVRGLLAGNGRFGAYGGQLAADGVVRVIGAGALVLLDVRSAVAFGVVLVAAPVVAVVLTTPWKSGLVRPGPPSARREVHAVLGLLVTASLASQLVANAGPVVVQVLAEPGDEARTAQFVAALVVARVPLFAFAAVQAVLLPGLSALVAARDPRGFGRRLGLVTAVTGVLGGLGVLVVAVMGEQVVRVLFGADFAAGASVVVVIAVSGALFMLAQLFAQGLLALGGDRDVAFGWGLGVVALTVTAVGPGDAVDVAARALVVGSAAALAVLSVLLARRAVHWRARARSEVPRA